MHQNPDDHPGPATGPDGRRGELARGEADGGAAPRRRPRHRRIAVITAVVVAVIAVLALVVGPKIYAANESSDVAAPTLDASTGGEGTIEANGTWTPGAGSYAGYRVDEVLRGENVTVVGRTEKVTGSATVEAGRLTAGQVDVDLASVTTDSDRRDSYFTSKAIDTAAHPTATFRLTEPVELGEVGSTPGTVPATGELTVNGKTVPVNAQLQVARDGDGLAVAGSVPLTWTDVGVEPPSLGFVQVADSGSIEFRLDMTR